MGRQRNTLLAEHRGVWVRQGTAPVREFLAEWAVIAEGALVMAILVAPFPLLALAGRADLAGSGR